MIAVPALDLREGACVQLVGGDYDAERVRLPDPVAVAERWARSGFSHLHLVDLDRATGRGDNDGTVTAVLSLRRQRVQVGGGVASASRIEALLAAGADTVVVGTKAVEDADWLAAVAARWPGRLVVAADVRQREVVTRGWGHGAGVAVDHFLARIDPLPLAGVLVTAVHREGRLEGPDHAVIEEAVRTSRHPIHASGGIGTIEDLRALAAVGAARAVIGMALYTDRIDPIAVGLEFAE
ncbi:MAG: 1-(5-phosphoribosyl)-5-[(5-phosphoribosylamino)methylideneamino] imidazole-4-carboxamide isomerase [Gemmatimonadetes bacterium]|nr:1-(5-phosphoribosyl)-5-[(5-phosphoribosylamino)methylideneamino] imidazole-4-carboxamide isomerase [Gemmatimonadota bacterium]